MEQNSLFNNISIHSVNAEKSVLSAIFLDTDTILEVSEKLKPEHFFNQQHQVIYKAMLEIANRNLRINELILQEHLTNTGNLEKAGGITYLLEIQEDIAPLNMLQQYIDLIINKSMQRDFINTLANAISSAKNNSDDILSHIDETQQKLMDISQKKSLKDYQSLGTLVKQTIKNISSPEQEGSKVGVATGFHNLDDLTAGLKNGNLIVLAARPSMGKTALALNIATNVAKKGKTVAFFSIEMTSEELVMRILSSASGINSRDINRSLLGQTNSVSFIQAVADTYELKIFVNDSPSLTMMQLRSNAKKLKLKEDVSLIIIDYLQLITAEGFPNNKNQEVSFISRSLKSLARELDIPILVLSQLSRGVESRQNKRPMLSDLRESGAIEQDADMVAFVYRDVMYNDETEYPDQAEIIIAKQRNGPIGTVLLRYVREITKFVDW